MESKRSTFRAALNYGVMAALGSFIYSILLYITKEFLNQGLSWINYVILVTAIVFAVMNRKNKDFGGFISFGEAFKLGFFVSLISGLIGVVTTYLMMTVIAPDMIGAILQKSQTDMINKGLSDDQVKAAMDMTSKFVTPTMMSVLVLIFVTAIGTILSLIVAAIFKKENTQLQAPQ